MRRIFDLYRASFAGLPRRVWLLCLITLVNRSGTMVLPFLSLYLTQDLGASIFSSGLALGAYGLGNMLGSLLGGQLSDRLGPVRTQILALLGQGVGFLVLARLGSIEVIAATLFSTAVVGESFRPANMAAIIDAAPAALRARAFALLRLAINVGMTLGPAVGGWLAVRDYSLLFWVDAVTCWAAAALLWWVVGSKERRPSPAPDAPGGDWSTTLRDRPLVSLVLLTFVLATCFFQLLSTVPLYYRQGFGLREDQIGLLLALNTGLIIGGEMVLVRLLENADAARVVGLGCVLVGGGFALMPLGEGVLFLALTVVVWTFGEMLTFPFSNGLAASRVAQGSSGRTMGLYTLAFAVASAVAPIAGMGIYEHWGPHALWYGVGGVGLLLWVGFRALSQSLAVEVRG